MRSRLLIPLMAFAVLTVMALVIPASLTLARARTQALQLSRGAAISHIAQLAESVTATREPSRLQDYLDRFHAVYGESVVVVDSAGRVLSAVGDLDAADQEVQGYVQDALRDLPRSTVPTIMPWSPDDALLAEPVGSVGSTSTGAVVLRTDLRAARTDVLQSWLVVAALAAALLVGLAVGSQRWVGWVLRPVRALDRAAREFPGRRDLEAVSGGPPELQELSASVSRMARGLEDLLEQQRGFVADASHQLRNPLAAIRLRMDGLSEEEGIEYGAGEQQRELAAVSRDLDRLEHIVERMLVLATAEHRATSAATGVGDHVAEASRPDHTVPSAAALAEPFRDLVANAGQTLHAVGDDEVLIACRRSDLEEIVGNLLENASKYAGPDATITVRLEPSTDEVAIVVEDDGPGLTAEELRHVGTRFWRSQRHNTVPGTGLGLAIVHQLVAANDGTMEVGTSNGGGLLVTLRFRRLR